MSRNASPNLNPHVEMAIAVVILLLSASAQAVITFSNTTYVSANFGLIMVLAYLSATVVILLRPLILPYIDEEIKHHKAFHTALLAFIAIPANSADSPTRSRSES